MRQLLISILLFTSLFANAQTETKEEEDNDSIDVEIIKLPETTAIGAAAGKLISKEIGVSGGKIVSDDGRVELIFPEGALKETTTISIQPIENLLPNGNDKGYRFEPSGIKFEKPVELIFHYSKEDEASCPALFMFMAIQDDKGKWEYMDYEDWDSTRRILKGFIHHFSQMVNGKQVRLSEEELTMKVGEKHNFQLYILQPPPPPAAPGEDELANVYMVAPLGNENAEWLVNGKKGGDDKFGFITSKNKPTARYSAPKIMPGDEFVTIELKTYIKVTTETSTRSRKSKMVTKTSKREYLASLSCKVRLYDEYRITIKVEGKSILECGAELADSSNFNIKIFAKRYPTISELKNRPPELTKQPGCRPLKYETAGCLGPVQVNYNLLEKYEFKSPPGDVTMEFTPVEVRIIKSSGKYKEEKHDFPGGDLDVNVGNSIKFKANRTFQKYKLAGHDIYVYPL